MTQVTAHDFYDEFHAHNDLPGVFFPDECEKGIESLLSQVRAQAHAEGRWEGLNDSKDKFILEIQDFTNPKRPEDKDGALAPVLKEFSKTYFNRGRLQGLKEMDEAYGKLSEDTLAAHYAISDRRKEYQQSN